MCACLALRVSNSLFVLAPNLVATLGPPVFDELVDRTDGLTPEDHFADRVIHQLIQNGALAGKRVGVQRRRWIGLGERQHRFFGILDFDAGGGTTLSEFPLPVFSTGIGARQFQSPAFTASAVS